MKSTALHTTSTASVAGQRCYHCGDTCTDTGSKRDGRHFCCEGCYSVYLLLQDNNLCTYYAGADTPGVNQKNRINTHKYQFLDNVNVQKAYILFEKDNEVHVRFYLPSIHCSSCVWLLEKLHRLNTGIISSRVDFDRKEITVIYNPTRTSLRSVVSAMASVGYEPELSLNDLDRSNHAAMPTYKSRLYKLGIAGFCFGNIMLFSFPEYLGMKNSDEFTSFFPWVNFALALPVFFYSATEFSRPAWKAIRHGFVSVEIPVYLAILVTFIRSVTDILAGWGPGFFDSMTGIVFFMLAGRVFQDKSYTGISFYRSYQSYLPVSAAVIRNNIESYIPVNEIITGDIMIIRNNEIVPADSKVLTGEPHMDYSFVTGEAALVKVKAGDSIYAGGKHLGQAITVEVQKEVSQSYLTTLWNNPRAGKNERSDLSESFIHLLGAKFTWLVLGVAVVAATWWAFTDVYRAFNAFTSVLIIACPCALLLSSSFTYGNMLRIFGKNGCYLRNPVVIENMARIQHVVFDKTGTLTSSKDKQVEWMGEPLQDEIRMAIASLVYHSQHPNSRIISSELSAVTRATVNAFKEIPGKGLSGTINGIQLKVGSASWCNAAQTAPHVRAVHVNVNGKWTGCFTISAGFRNNVKEVIDEIELFAHVSLISGDNDSEREFLSTVFPPYATMIFNAVPEQKKNYISNCKKEVPTAMVGDGLNDVSALQESNVGIAIAEEGNNFTPSCDAVLDNRSFSLLPKFLRFSKSAKSIIIGSFIISLVYNVIGVAFAVQGTFSPLLAAIIMPLSTLTIVLYTTLAGNIEARKLSLKTSFSRV